ncbi:MAG: aspartate kinase [Candidatus Lokiarchaeota archaeon]|nr:aspartate kinase [Candidatus Lokiarchaeota archaeon]
MTVVIMKFGGSCLTDSVAFDKIANITNIYKDSKKLYVASAFNGITDLLLTTAKNLDDKVKVDKNIALIEKRHINVIEEIFDEEKIFYRKAKDWVDQKLSELESALGDVQEFGLEPYYSDYILSFGEILSTYILNQYLLSRGYDSIFLSADHLIVTNDNFGKAYPLYQYTDSRIKEKIVPLLGNPKKNAIFCITGFLGRNKMGYITTLGRGGSDYTATILARSIYDVGNDKDIKVILWKDVDGLLAINPKYVKNSALIRRIDYDEAKEIANFGAKVLHPKCLEAIEKRKIPLEIRNFDKPLELIDFTSISELTDKEQIKGISAVEDATIINVTSGSMVDVPGVLAKIFKIMGKNGISVSLVAQSSSEISTSFIINEKDSEKALKALNTEEFFSDFYEIEWEKVAIINITGKKILENNTKAKLFKALDKKNINVRAISQSFEELNLSLVINRGDLKEAIQIIHDDLCEDFEAVICKDGNE